MAPGAVAPVQLAPAVRSVPVAALVILDAIAVGAARATAKLAMLASRQLNLRVRFTGGYGVGFGMLNYLQIVEWLSFNFPHDQAARPIAGTA